MMQDRQMKMKSLVVMLARIMIVIKYIKQAYLDMYHNTVLYCKQSLSVGIKSSDI